MDKKFILDTEENKKYLEHGMEALLKFGEGFASEKGSSYYLLKDGAPDKKRPKETWITARMIHSYGCGKMIFSKVNKEKEKLYKSLTDLAVSSLLNELYDERTDSFYEGINPDGTFLPGKMCYTNAFLILAGVTAKLSGAKDSDILLKSALNTYDKYFWNEDTGLSNDNWDTDYKALSDYRGLNSNMHSVEAFLALSDGTGDETYRKRAGRIIRQVILFERENDNRIPEHYDKDWNTCLYMNIDNKMDKFKPYGATPGHGIEWARLITQYALSDKDISKDERDDLIKEACALYKRAYDDGWNKNNNPGFSYTTDWDGSTVCSDRMHWTLAEAINTSSVLYRVTGEDRYKDDYSAYLKYLDDFVLDKKYGSWFHQLDENNNLKETVWPGKPDIYHAFQAMIIPYIDPGCSIAAALKKEIK